MVDFQHWAVVAHKDDTGFGRMAADARRILGLGRHIVIPSERLADHPLDRASECLLRPDAPDDRVVEVLAGLQGIVFFERAAWHPLLLATARRLGVKSVCIPMWEWFKGDAPEWRHCDLFACPSEFSATIVRRYGWRNVVVLPWAIDVARLPRREIRGPARCFVHNAGLVDHDDRKGTYDAIEAFSRVPGKDLRLVVRMQEPIRLPPLDQRIEVQVGNLANPGALYVLGDCMIQPSKMEGIGFMVLEPVVCGIPVITLDYPPMSEFVAQRELRVKRRWFKRRAFPNHWIPHAHLRLPCRRDLARKIAWCAANDLGPASRANRAWSERQFAPGLLRERWSRVLAALP
ncbi:MAG TPA: glycosyltransferase [Opitutaceae bacterium]|nr:glycosyltransferase [Opitutaceae bacterium]